MTQPPGWYDDPNDPALLRYFDGAMWTSHVEPKQNPQLDPGQAVDHGTYPAAPGESRYANPGQTPYAPSSPYAYGAAPQVGWSHSGPTTPDGAPLAEWWQRLIAVIIDALVSSILWAIAASYWINQLFETSRELLVTGASGDFDELAGLINELPPELASTMWWLVVIQVLVYGVYQVIFLTRWGATPGKMVMGIRVRRVNRPGPLTVVESLRRVAIMVSMLASRLVPLLNMVTNLASILDSLWLLWDPRRQTLHDKLADTLVEKAPKTR